MDSGNETTVITTTATAFAFTYNPNRYPWTNVHRFNRCDPAFTELKKDTTGCTGFGVTLPRQFRIVIDTIRELKSCS